MNLWHALRRECTGAWRSVRYDLATHRAARLAGAFTEEFQPGSPPVPAPSRMVPLTGVTLLLIGGTAGAFLAISGGLAALGGPAVPPMTRDHAATASRAPAVGEESGPDAAASPMAPLRAPATARPSPSPGPATPPAATAPAPPVTEGTSTAASASTTPSASASEGPEPSVSASESSQESTEGPRSPVHRGRR